MSAAAESFKIKMTTMIFSQCFHYSKSTSMSLDLWKIFCSITGKSLAKSHVTVPSKMTNRWIKFCNLKIAGSGNVFRQYYYRNPCVPVDFRNINDAIRYCPRNKSTPFPLEDEERYYSDEGSVVLMPGVYEERITVHGEPFVAGHTIRSITIRAAFPSIGATLVHYDCQRISSSVKNQSAITVSTRSEDDDFDESGICVKLSHLQILHSTPGADIWGGNTAVLLDGLRAQAVVHCCKIQSDSGRGVVVTNQAELQMTHSSIVNCAATGFYLGDRCVLLTHFITQLSVHGTVLSNNCYCHSGGQRQKFRRLTLSNAATVTLYCVNRLRRTNARREMKF